jgi:endo-1,4-beta-xylanase
MGKRNVNSLIGTVFLNRVMGMLGIILASLAFQTNPTHAGTKPEVPLRVLARKRGIDIGSAIKGYALSSDEEYSGFAGKQFSILTPENDLKFDAIHPDRDRFDFTIPDALVQFAKKHHQRLRGHTLVWSNPEAIPDWVKKATPGERPGILKAHIDGTLEHFKKSARGVLTAWDVLNEALDGDGKLKRGTLWDEVGATEEEFFTRVFSWAHATDPSLKLFYNDYDLEEPGPKADALYALLKILLKKKVPIHGLGFQFHLSPAHDPDWKAIKKNLRRFAALGLKIHITEMDDAVALKDDPKVSGAKQAEGYSKALEVCLSVRGCGAFITWGFTDRYQWLPNFDPGMQDAAYLDSKYQPKEAYSALRARFFKSQSKNQLK